MIGDDPPAHIEERPENDNGCGNHCEKRTERGGRWSWNVDHSNRYFTFSEAGMSLLQSSLHFNDLSWGGREACRVPRPAASCPCSAAVLRLYRLFGPRMLRQRKRLADRRRQPLAMSLPQARHFLQLRNSAFSQAQLGQAQDLCLQSRIVQGQIAFN